MNFMFSWQKQYLTHSLRSLVSYCSCHSNTKFISSRQRVISSMYWPFRLVCMPFKTKEYLTAGSTPITANFVWKKNISIHWKRSFSCTMTSQWSRDFPDRVFLKHKYIQSGDCCTVFKTDSAQSSSNKWKNYSIKIYSQHINFLNTIWNFSL